MKNSIITISRPSVTVSSELGTFEIEEDEVCHYLSMCDIEKMTREEGVLVFTCFAINDGRGFDWDEADYGETLKVVIRIPV